MLSGLAVVELAAVLGNHLATAHPSEVSAAVALVDAAKAKSAAAAAAQQQLATAKPASMQQPQQGESSPAGSVRNKSVWCPVCNQGFTRQYNLKVSKHTCLYYRDEKSFS